MQVQIRHLVLSLGLSCGLPFCSALAQESEKPVRMRDLPAAVQATVREQRKGAVLLGLAQETENGQTSYEAEWRVNGHNKDVLMDAAGKVVVVEEHVNFAALPPVVQTGLRKLAGRGRIVLIESITKDDELVAYEAQVKTGVKRREFKVKPDGSPATP